MRLKNLYFIVLVCSVLWMTSCDNDSVVMDSDMNEDNLEVFDENFIVNYLEIPKRSGERPVTTPGVPHVQIGVEPVREVHEELYRRVYSIEGIERRASVIAGWEGMWIKDEVRINRPNSLIGGREFGHIHDDGSLHIFLEPSRSTVAIDSCWAVIHPFAAEQRAGWDGFIMLYTPQSIEELNVTFQLIVDGYNYVTAQNILATTYY